MAKRRRSSYSNAVYAVGIMLMILLAAMLMLIALAIAVHYG